jgi:hypothetical protein
MNMNAQMGVSEYPNLEIFKELIDEGSKVDDPGL